MNYIPFSLENFAKYCLNINPEKFIWKSLEKKQKTDKTRWQQFNTPDEICNQMVNMYKDEFDSNDKILILFNLEFIKALALNYENINYSNIFFVTDCEEDFYWIKKHFKLINIAKLEKFDVDILTQYIREFNMKKFDIVFSNPPYNNNLDLKILQSIFPIAKNIIFIHPASWLLDKKFICEQYNEIRNTKFLKDALLTWKNDEFKIGLFCPICISHWTPDYKNEKCKIIDSAYKNEMYKCNVNDVSIFGSSFNKVNNFKNFIEKTYKENSFKNNIKNSNELTDYSIKFAAIRGHVGNKPKSANGLNNDFYTLLSPEFKKYNYISSNFKYGNHDKDNAIWRLTFSFNSENERIHFSNYCKTKIVRFILSFYKKGSHLDSGEVYNIPWLDFTQDWDDKKLCKEFEIDNDLWNYINSFIPDYYDDYKSGFED